MENPKKKIIILGAGPAGLAAGLELTKNGQEVVIIEGQDRVGGLAKTVNYKGYYFETGGHRFFTKNEEINRLWHEILGKQFIKRARLSRIYYRHKFFNYPLKPLNALIGIGLIDTFKIIFSYLTTRLGQRLRPQPEITFEDWVRHRFGQRLFQIFFKTYTEKVWGIPTSRLGAEWAAQRIKGLSLSQAILNAFLGQRKNKIKTLIDYFHYPLYGPGMMYQAIANRIKTEQGQILLNSRIISISHQNSLISQIKFRDKDGLIKQIKGYYFLSSIPLTELVHILEPPAPKEIQTALAKLKFRAFISVNLILDRENVFPDNWIYIHSPEVRVARMQSPKNWSPAMTPDSKKTPLSLEYFCQPGDQLWQMSNQELINLAKRELEIMGLASAEEVLDGFVMRVKDAYPIYEIGYRPALEKIISFVQQFKNCQIIGRGGMYRYNNMDHSMLTGILAARNILGAKHNIFQVNLEEEYHEIQR